MWDFSKANTYAIKKGVSGIDWKKSLNDLNINDQVKFLTDTVLNIFSNFVPNKIISIP